MKKIFSHWESWMFIGLVSVFYLICFFDYKTFRWLVEEDALVEWSTVVFLFVSFLLMLGAAFFNKSILLRYKIFIVAFAAFCFLAAMEEMSWGQRVLEIDSGEFFKKHSDQGEINIHNTFQKITYIKTKHLAAVVLCFYAIIIPVILDKYGLKGKWRILDYILFPGRRLWLGFLIGAILTVDQITPKDEEIAELLFSMCFVLFALRVTFGQIATEEGHEKAITA